MINDCFKIIIKINKQYHLADIFKATSLSRRVQHLIKENDKNSSTPSILTKFLIENQEV